jgi:hypothetical protein
MKIVRIVPWTIAVEWESTKVFLEQFTGFIDDCGCGNCEIYTCD